MAKRKQDGLYRRGGVFGFRFKDASGAWKEKLTSCSDREAAKEFKRKFLEDVKNGHATNRHGRMDAHSGP